MNWLEAIILGLIQGLTEFLPVSSSGHLEIGKHLFGVDPELSFEFSVAVHGATVLSILFVFWKDIWRLISGIFMFRINDETVYVFKILISMIPVGIVGIFLNDRIESLFVGNILLVGSMLIVTSVILLLGHVSKPGEKKIGFLDSLVIGIAQALAVIPGISRSGSTIAAGLILGNKKSEVARFSFLMVIFPIIGANIIEIASGEFASSGGSGSLIILAGFISAFVSGYLACRWMLAIVRRGKLIWFALYCFVVGLISIVAGL